MKKKVVVGMSGGVDSSVAAYLLKQQGYDVIGVTMQIWQDEVQTQMEENSGCCGLSAVDDARRVAEQLDIPYYVMNFKNEFRKYVMDYFIEEYRHGRTPNPCIACNRYLKWEALLQRSMEIGADYIATGHYAQVEQLSNGRYSIKNSLSAHKDQTYVLYNLTQEQLSRTLMPVGAFEKDEIRHIAEKIGLMVANKKDSQDICFIPDNDYAGFLEKEGGNDLPLEGNFVLQNGEIVGRHLGIHHYTIGQRKGLNLALGKPVFVNHIDVKRNEVVVGDNADVFQTSLQCNQVNYMADEIWNEDKIYLGKIRYSHQGTPCKVRRIDEDSYEVIFTELVRAVTPGQAVVLYDGEYVAGGGTIL